MSFYTLMDTSSRSSVAGNYFCGKKGMVQEKSACILLANKLRHDVHHAKRSGGRGDGGGGDNTHTHTRI